MKTSHFSSLFIIVFFSNFIYAQWNPPTTSTTATIYRAGSVGIGLNNTPAAQLHVLQGVYQTVPGQEVGFVPAFRLQREINVGAFSDGTYIWDFFPNEGLQINYGDGSTSFHAMNIQPYGLEVAGNKLELGYGGNSGSDNLTLGYSTTLNGHYIAFNGTREPGNWKGENGKVVIHSDLGGNLYFVTQAANPGTTLLNGQNRRLSITPEGTTVIGDEADTQFLTVSSNLRSVLRFERKGAGPDFEMLRNEDGDLEFRGGQDGAGAVLPSLMKLRKTGKLVIGTEETPTDLDNGDTNINAYRLFVEGGILTKEARVRTEWSDYVFEENYALLPLDRVKAHIETHGHLHDTPSGAEIEKHGLELGAMTSNQQAKIEEIFLHLIELKEKLDELEKENERLKIEIESLKK